MLEVRNITKRFPGVTALDNVSIRLDAGNVTALLGENGAGKSTLMKTLSGVYSDYEGEILLRDKTVRFSSPKQAQDAGIAIVHQELNLVSHLSISENLFLGRELTTAFGLLDKIRMRKKTAEILETLQLDLSPDTQIANLKVGQQQLVEIGKTLLLDADVVIMDEPTSAITGAEVAILFEIIREIKRSGKAIAYISHKLDELFEIADHYVVLRDGKSVDKGSMSGISHDELISKMVGRKVEEIRKPAPRLVEKPVLEVERLCLKSASSTKKDILKDISFRIAPGEIVGLFGLMGAGRTELLESLFGLHPKTTTGTIRINEKTVAHRCPADAIKAGFALVPEDRKYDGLVLELDVKKNLSLTTLENLEHFGLLDAGKESELADCYTRMLQIKTLSSGQLVKNLSGGNQQKIVLGKWLAKAPKLLLLDEPTRGIDINAKSEIYRIILDVVSSQGTGILMVSSELPEILAVSHRILVMAEGRITAEIPADRASEDTILKAAIPPSSLTARI